MPISHPITNLSGIDAETAAILKANGIRTSAKLLEAARTPRGRKALAQRTGISEKDLLCWANAADRMRIKGVGEEYSSLLQAAGVDTVKELKYRNPERLAKAMKEANARRKIVGVLPSDRAVVRWIEYAKKLPLKITY
jgi:predicted flap endonuclease-1-like 5' DNA nuclease